MENVGNAGMRTNNIKSKNERPNKSNRVHKREGNVLLMPGEGGKTKARKGIRCRIRGTEYHPENASTTGGKTGKSTKSNMASTKAMLQARMG
jgi:hypothetical protein